MRARLDRRVQLAGEDIHRVMLDPAGFREVLLELVLGDRRDLASVFEEHCARAGGALVERKNILSHLFRLRFAHAARL
jgi:hypothetical protein